jgi:hypothetical protein
VPLDVIVTLRRRTNYIFPAKYAGLLAGGMAEWLDRGGGAERYIAASKGRPAIPPPPGGRGMLVDAALSVSSMYLRLQSDGLL